MSIFGNTLFTRYRARIVFRDKLMGGTPKDPKLIEGWLRSKAGIDDAVELHQAMLRTLQESGFEVRPDMTYAEVEEAVDKVAGVKQTSGFKRGSNGLYFESRQVKAALNSGALAA